jgi:hypothetical protein
MFERAAYGCKLFCCWCAQDIEANYFWQSLGFVALAFRAGSREKGRVHIFWQRRIRAGDDVTPYWFPSQTSSGSIREDRLVLPIPPGMHWSDAKPLILPQEENTASEIPACKPIAKMKRPLDPVANALRGFTFQSAVNARASAEKSKRPPCKRSRVKNHPKYIAAARELRDRWLEAAAASPSVLLSQGKYDLSKEFPATRSKEMLQLPPLSLK